MKKEKFFLKELFTDTLRTGWMMLKILIPVSVVVKILQETGAIEYLGVVLSPLMMLVGLPGEMGLVWVTGMITNLFGGVLAYMNLAPYYHLDVAQTTVLCLMMLVAHTFPIELQIAKKAGVKFITMFLFRFGFAFLMGFVLNLVYHGFSVLQEPAVITWKQMVVMDTTWQQWAIGELKNYGTILLFIFSLLFLVKILKQIGVISIITKGLSPLLRMMGIGAEVTTIAIIGLTLGIVYGGVLIINESKSKSISKRDIFYCLALMGLCHSLIEDTILMMALGGHYTGILIFRVFISFLIIWAVVKITKRLSDNSFAKYFLSKK
ncbi:MAG: nucleoside recognition domain-containing protein [Bacteroidota bacterium]